MLSTLNNLSIHRSSGTAFQSRSFNLSSVPSLRSNDASRRQNIIRRINVSIMALSACGTFPLANLKRQALNNVSAVRACFTRREKSVYNPYFSSVHLCLRFEHYSKHSERSVRNTFRKLSIFDHSSYVEIFDADNVKTTNKIGCQLVQKVLSTVCSFLLNFSNPKPLSVSSPASFHSARKNALSPFKSLLLSRNIFRIFNLFAIRKSGQVSNTKINTNTLTCFQHLFSRLIQAKRNEVLTVLSFCNRHGSRITFKSATPFNIQLSYFGKLERSFASFSIKFESTFSKLCRLFSMLLFKTWEASSLLKEIDVGSVQMPECLLKRDTRNIFQPTRFGSFFKLCKRGRRFAEVYLLSFFEGIRSKIEAPIVDVSRAPESLAQGLFLSLCRVTSKLIPNFHELPIPHLTEKWALPPLPEGWGLRAKENR